MDSEADSLIAQVVATDSLEFVPVDSLSIASLIMDEEQVSPARAPIFVEDVYQTVVDEYSGSPYAARASSILAVIVDLRDSVRVAENKTAADSLRLVTVEDSIRTAILSDSLGLPFVADTLSTTLSADSLAVFAVVDSTSGIVQADLSADYRQVILDDTPVKNSVNSGAVSTDGAQVVPSPARPNVAVGAVAVARTGGEFPSFPVLDEEIEDEEILQLDSIKPLMMNGKPDQQTSGWTVVLEGKNSLKEAEEARILYTSIKDSTGIPIMVLVDVRDDIGLYRVAWGVFPTLSAAESAIREEEPKLPVGYSFLRMLPMQDR